jgi:hypothetical protein
MCKSPWLMRLKEREWNQSRWRTKGKRGREGNVPRARDEAMQHLLTDGGDEDLGKRDGMQRYPPADPGERFRVEGRGSRGLTLGRTRRIGLRLESGSE